MQSPQLFTYDYSNYNSCETMWLGKIAFFIIALFDGTWSVYTS